MIDPAVQSSLITWSGTIIGIIVTSTGGVFVYRQTKKAESKRAQLAQAQTLSDQWDNLTAGQDRRITNLENRVSANEAEIADLKKTVSRYERIYAKALGYIRELLAFIAAIPGEHPKPPFPPKEIAEDI